MVIEAGAELTLKAGGSFIKLDASGVTMVGPLVRVNAGVSPGTGSGIAIKAPVLPGAADGDRAGEVTEQALINASLERPQAMNFFLFSE